MARKCRVATFTSFASKNRKRRNKQLTDRCCTVRPRTQVKLWMIGGRGFGVN